MKKIIFTGGGTGGHIMPNIAIMQQLKGKYQIEYIGSKQGMEKQIAGKLVPYFEIETCKLKRSFSPSNLLIPFKLIKGICDAKKILKREKPDLVFSKGGYVSVPVVIACHSLKIPVVSHESDFSMGLANKLTSKYCTVVCTSFEATSHLTKNGVFTGSPIRRQIYEGWAQNAVGKLSLDKKLPNLLIVCGSLGSTLVDNLIFENADKLSKKFNIIHITSNASNLKTNIQNYNLLSYSNKIQDLYALSDYVITRGGSNVIFELLALKKPMLIIPLGKGSRGDQIENAKEFAKHNFAKVLFESDAEKAPDLLLKKVSELVKDRDRMIESMKNAKADGTKNIIKQIEKVLQSKNN